MDWSIILGVIGIVVSVIVGWLTYVLANRRARNHRYQQAKGTVLQELSKSLGEDAVPPTAVMQATIRSVLREVGDPKVELSLDEVLDDLVRQVTSDPFLNVERRKQLQSGIESVRAEALARHRQPDELAFERYSRSYARSSSLSALAGLIAASVTALVSLAAFTPGAFKTVGEELKKDPPILVQVLLGIVALAAVLTTLSGEYGPLEALKRKIRAWRGK